METDINKVRNLILQGIKSKRMSVKRKQMEVNLLTRRHNLILLPYQAMLGHIGHLVEERRSQLEEIPLTNNTTTVTRLTSSGERLNESYHFSTPTSTPPYQAISEPSSNGKKAG